MTQSMCSMPVMSQGLYVSCCIVCHKMDPAVSHGPLCRTVRCVTRPICTRHKTQNIFAKWEVQGIFLGVGSFIAHITTTHKNTHILHHVLFVVFVSGNALFGQVKGSLKRRRKLNWKRAKCANISIDLPNISFSRVHLVNLSNEYLSGLRLVVKYIPREASLGWLIKFIPRQASLGWLIKYIPRQASPGWLIKNIPRQASLGWLIKYIPRQASLVDLSNISLGRLKIYQSAGFAWLTCQIYPSARFAWLTSNISIGRLCLVGLSSIHCRGFLSTSLWSVYPNNMHPSTAIHFPPKKYLFKSGDMEGQRRIWTLMDTHSCLSVSNNSRTVAGAFVLPRTRLSS